MIERAYRIEEASELTGFHCETLRRWLRSGILEGMKAGKTWLIPADAVTTLVTGKPKEVMTTITLGDTPYDNDNVKRLIAQLKKAHAAI